MVNPLRESRHFKPDSHLVCFKTLFFLFLKIVPLFSGLKTIIYQVISMPTRPTMVMEAKLSPQFFSTLEPLLGRALSVSVGKMATF